ncbi:MAG TPA: phosphate starvation-inducible protein PsiF [Moraxellaceae bacterium]|nr:phosphate starvation-inducible protein PsiF [Moraxellaceae bacterium]
MDIMKKTTLKNGCRSLLLLTTLGLGIGANPVMANTSQHPDNDCNSQAAGKSGDARRQAIAQCIRKRAQVDNMPPMLAKVSACNRKAGDMAGDARSSFMDSCMKNN